MESPSEGTPRRRLIKRYSNRKLYDTEGSRYVTLLEIGDLVRAGEEVEVIDNQTKEDKTEATLALIISEELKERPRGIPLATLKALIRHRGERLLSTLREGPMRRLITREDDAAAPTDAATAPEPPPGDEPPPNPPDEPPSPPPPTSLATLRRTLEQWQAAVDERLRSVLPASADVEELKLQIRALNERLARLERRVGPLDGAERDQPE
jgi:polyhydroxyalkanoate synthesis repressor PhaR